MSVKLELSDDEARMMRDRWAGELNQHRAAIELLSKQIATVDAQLNGQLPLIVTMETTTTGKRKKGQNFRTIEEFIKNVGTHGATVADIHRMTKLPVSSCIAVLKRHDEIFARADDGLWRIKRDAHK